MPSLMIPPKAAWIPPISAGGGKASSDSQTLQSAQLRLQQVPHQYLWVTCILSLLKTKKSVYAHQCQGSGSATSSLQPCNFENKQNLILTTCPSFRRLVGNKQISLRSTLNILAFRELGRRVRK